MRHSLKAIDLSSLRPGLIRLSLFRWRLEWVFLVAAAAGLVLSEQAIEAQARDPYRLFEEGRTAAATVLGGRQELATIAIRRGEPQTELRTYIDLAWFDAGGTRLRVTGYRLDPETAAGLAIDAPAGRWPSYVNVQHLEQASSENADTIGITSLQSPQDVTSRQYQRTCAPARDCRLAVLLPAGKTPAEREIDNIHLMLDWGPRALWLGLCAFLLSLGLRFAGYVDNPPSLE